MTELRNVTGASGVFEINKSSVKETIEASKVEIEASATSLSATRSLRIGLIDCYKFSQECLIKALYELEPQPTIVPFMTVQQAIAQVGQSFDVLIYYSHSTDSFERTIVDRVATIRQAFQTSPIVVLSDAEVCENPYTIRSLLKNGAQGFIPTRTTGIPITFAAIRFITAGGVFAPLDLLLANRMEPVDEEAQEVRSAVPNLETIGQSGLPAPVVDAVQDTASVKDTVKQSQLPEPGVEAVLQNRLTTRQLAVLNHLQQGKANKVIAFELGMSESTVKVHIRNIMRKTGATNRTQAAFKAQGLWGNAATSRMIIAGSY